MRQFFVSLAIALWAVPVFGQPLADKVPANSLVYFGWRGSDDLGSAYADSHLKAILDQSNIRAVFTDMLPRTVMHVSRDNLEAGNALRIASNITGILWHHPCAIYLSQIDVDGKDYHPKAAILCQAGNDSASLLAQALKALLKQADRTPVPLRAFQSGDIVAFTIGYAETEDAVALAAEKPLNRDADFSTALGKVLADPVVAVYVNGDRIGALIDDIIAQDGDPKAKEYWPRIREASGIAGLKRLIATGAFDGKDWMNAAFIDAPSPHTGLLAMLDSSPLSDDLLKLAPMDSDHLFAGTFNLGKFISTIRATIAQVDPQAGELADKGFSAISLFVGKDFQKEVLDTLGEHWMRYSSPTIAGRGFLGGVLINKPTDAAKASQGLMATQLAIFNTAGPFLSRKNITLRAQNIKSGDLSINYVAVPLISPAWCVNNGNLYVSLYPQTIISAAHFASSGGKSILDNPSFTNLRKRLGAPDKINGICYLDLPQTAGDGYQSVLALTRLVLGCGDLYGVRSPEPVMPPLETVLQNVGPSGSISWVDEAGWHCKSVSSFPGAEVLGENSHWVSGLLELAPLAAKSRIRR